MFFFEIDKSNKNSFFSVSLNVSLIYGLKSPLLSNFLDHFLVLLLKGKLQVFFHVLNSCLLLKLVDATPNEVDLLLVVVGLVVTLQEQEAEFLFLP